ncbi:MAG: hypothetical protein ACI8UO_003459 [Verrucomicrobiales bacterium]|jgi:hypothetical protein
MERIKTHGGEEYRLIETRDPKADPDVESIVARTARMLQYFKGDQLTPDVEYADPNRIVLEWVEGIPFANISLTAEDFKQLGAFVPRGFKEIEESQVAEEDSRLNSSLKRLSARNERDSEMASRVSTLLGSIGQLSPSWAMSAVCFGDTVTKNFLRTDKGELRYIDVMGIYRKSIGVVFAKQLSMVPVEFRRRFFESYNAAFAEIAGDDSDSLATDLPFYFIEFILGKLVKSHKVRRFSRVNQGRTARSIISSFSDLESHHDHVVDWILDAADTMV